MKKILAFVLALGLMACAIAKEKKYSLKSPNGKLEVEVSVDNDTYYRLILNGNELLGKSQISLDCIDNGDFDMATFSSFEDYVPKVTKVLRRSVDEMVASPFTRQAQMRDHYNAMTLLFPDNWQLEFRAYDEGMAYRIVYKGEDSLLATETVEFRMPRNYGVWAPYVTQYDPKHPEVMYGTSFENTYTHTTINELQSDRLCFLPLLVDCGNRIKMCITESHLEAYPGLYLCGNGDRALLGGMAPYPTKLEQGGHNNLQMRVKESDSYRARWKGEKELPWRIVMVSESDRDLAMNNMSYLLGAPCRLDDLSWIKPGKVAWEWWNNWNLEGVDFKTGVNNDTYKYYIDFASKHGIEYVILDEGWAVNLECDLFKVVPEIDLQMLVDYAAERNVGIILWAGYWAFDRDMEQVCEHYSKMGVKGFKVDFMDRDDQIITDFYYRAAATAARYHLMLDFHGTSKPAGLNRTYPNVVNFEGVAGLENLKWAPSSWDMPKYDCELPFIRQASGPMDYTQGAMINATRGSYYPCWSEPMSQGTRCHQLGLYVVFESPLSMLCDSPTNYEREEECTQLIASMPTVWDETKVLEGTVGRYVVTARRKGNDWYIGGIASWEWNSKGPDKKEYVLIDFDELGITSGDITLYSDGTNAHRKGTDYKVSHPQFSKTMDIEMAPGGGFLMVIKQ